MNATLRLWPSTRVRRQLGDVDLIDIDGPDGQLTIRVDPFGAQAAADLGCALLAASRRQSEPAAGPAPALTTGGAR